MQEIILIFLCGNKFGLIIFISVAAFSIYRGRKFFKVFNICVNLVTQKFSVN